MTKPRARSTPKAPRVRPTLTHVVLAGEGFLTIGRRYGVNAGAIARVNGLTLTSVIVPGQKLRIPGGGPVTRTVRKPHPCAVRRASRIASRGRASSRSRSATT